MIEFFSLFRLHCPFSQTQDDRSQLFFTELDREGWEATHDEVLDRCIQDKTTFAEFEGKGEDRFEEFEELQVVILDKGLRQVIDHWVE